MTDTPKNDGSTRGSAALDLPPVLEEEPKEEMISKADVDKYIQDQINKQWANKVEMEKAEKKARHTREDEAFEGYTSTMKDSPEPWVDLKGYQETAQGLKISLDWNTAFIEHLHEEGLRGSDEDDIVHKWLSLLMKKVATEDDDPNTGEFE